MKEKDSNSYPDVVVTRPALPGLPRIPECNRLSVCLTGRQDPSSTRPWCGGNMRRQNTPKVKALGISSFHRVRGHCMQKNCS